MELIQETMDALGMIAGLIAISFSVFLIAELLARLLGITAGE